jgi:DNA invertase Pin-like site-specific DNA recombinase
MNLTRIYLRASTDHQDAERARGAVEAFAAERQLVVAATYVENESGAKLQRPELFRLLSHSKPGDVMLVEQIDRLSRLTDAGASSELRSTSGRSGSWHWICRRRGWGSPRQPMNSQGGYSPP